MVFFVDVVVLFWGDVVKYIVVVGVVIFIMGVLNGWLLI